MLAIAARVASLAILLAAALASPAVATPMPSDRGSGGDAQPAIVAADAAIDAGAFLLPPLHDGARLPEPDFAAAPCAAGSIAVSCAVVRLPEPTSLTLFAGALIALAGFAYLRAQGWGRRRSPKQKLK